MEQHELKAGKNGMHPLRRRCRKRWIRPLPLLFFCTLGFLTVIAVLTAVRLPARDSQIDPPVAVASQPVPSEQLISSEPAQESPLQKAAEAPTNPTPYAADSWKLLLVNPWNPLPENDSVQTVTLKNGLQVDERCYPDLQAMMDACRADGLSPVICSAYRTREKQETLFQNKVNRFIAQGYTESEARVEAGKVVAVPGTSEHQLGLAVDIVDLNNQNLDESQEHTAVQKWLMAHSWEYGFILRYPQEKSELTGITYEPWHYRYVGREDAAQIYALGVCLEEYLDM